MNYIVIAVLVALLVLCVCFLCYPSKKEGYTNSGTSETKKTFKTLALYHGGCTGCNYFSDDQWKKYCAAYWAFVKHAGINKAMFNLTDAGAKDSGTNLRHGDNILKYWIGSMPSELKNSVKIGFTVFPSAKYPWTWDCSLKGQTPGNCQPSWNYTQKKGSSSCCPGYSAGDAAPEGCPNNWEQVMNYIAYVNAKSTPKISFIVVDGEGEGGYTVDKAGFCPIMSAVAYGKTAGAIPKDFTVGVAHGPGNFCSGGQYCNTADCKSKNPKGKDTCEIMGIDDAYPELYWYGELADCAKAIKDEGSPAGYESTACTNTVYQKHINDPNGLLKAITDSSTPVGSYLNGMISEGIDGKSKNGLPLNVYKYDQTYPMFSTENINAQSGTGCSGINPVNGKKQCCIANYFYGEADSCGSFNGFGNWQLDKFLEFLNAFSTKFGSNEMAIYEWQYIPTAWIPDFDKIMGSSSLPSGPTPSGGGGGPSGPGAPFKPTPADDKYCKASCGSDAYCRGDNGFCHGTCPSGKPLQCGPGTKSRSGGSSGGGSSGGGGSHTGGGSSGGGGSHTGGGSSGGGGNHTGGGSPGGGSPGGGGSHTGSSGGGSGGSNIPSPHQPGSNPTPGGQGGGASPHGSSGVDAQGRGTLFLYPESNGFQIPDFGGFPDAQTVKKNFHTIAVVANHAGDYVSQWNDPHVLELKKNTGLPVNRWLAYYFGKDSSWACMCNWAGCKPGSMSGQPKNCTECGQAVLTEVTKNIQQHQISGILFDDEVGNPQCIVEAFEQAKDKFPSLQIGWTKSLGSAKQSSPENLGKDNWDICLGQAYTDTTNDFYNGSCNFASTFWSSVASAYDSSVTATRGVPMVCGAGNCIGEKDKSGQVYCTDERMSGSKISALLNSRPPAAQFKWRNFAIWYGTYAGKGFFGCTNSDVACKTACCKGWRQ